MPENKIPPLPEGASVPPLLGRRILVAVENTERLRRILDRHDLTVAATVERAKAEMQRQEFAMIILGVNFTSRLSDVAIEGLDHAVKAMLANAFLNLNRFRDDEAGNARVRRIIDYLILIDGDLHGGFESVHAKT